MAVQEKVLWKNWADGLRMEMMASLTSELTKSVDSIASETATGKAARTLRSASFWRACQQGIAPNDALATAGFEIEFEQDESGNVQDVTLRLNQTWLEIMQRVLDRQKT